jgi:putative spermidine/putrescine transport system substrate-binding protein
MFRKFLVALIGVSTAVMLLALPSAGASATGTKWKTATSAAAGGGMKALVKAAEKEGHLNVIALPPTWANYGTIIKAFEAKYHIKITDANPTGSSAQEIQAINELRGQSRAPDVVDVANSFAVTGVKSGLWAPYKVETWKTIPAMAKTAKGNWYDDYGGYVAIGYTATKVKNPPKSFTDLLKPTYKNEVGINTTPTEAGAAFAAVLAASIANKGSLGNIAPGVTYFKKLAAAGNFVPTKADPATVENGTTPIVIWWDYLEASEIASKLPHWKTVIPSDGSYAAFYTQAINKTAPDPAAARLWEEFLYSKEGQNDWLKGAAQPIEMQAMIKNKTITKKAEALLPPMPRGTLKLATPAELTKDATVLTHTWSTKVSS